MGFKSKIEVKVKDNWSNILKKLESLDGKEAAAGYDDRNHKPRDIAYSDLAAIHEFGAIGNWGMIPARSFMSQAFHDLLSEDSDFAECVANVIYGSSSADKELKKIAVKMKDGIQTAIWRGDFTDLSPVTVDIKGHSTPLRESDKLMNKVLAKVIVKGALDGS